MAKVINFPKGNVPTRKEKENMLDQAQMLIYDAWEEPSPAKLKAAAKKALNLSADCADAYLILADFAKTESEELSLLRSAVDAGERALGAKAFKAFTGEFWGFLETRPYMRALEQLGIFYEDTEQRNEAVDCFRRMIELNPNDNQGARHILLPLLIMMNRDAEAETLYAQYKADIFACWTYGRVLLDYRKHGPDSKLSVKHLKKALKSNPHVATFLTGRKNAPAVTKAGYTLGSEEEALEYIHNDARAWSQTPGAVAWLKSVTK